MLAEIEICFDILKTIDSTIETEKHKNRQHKRKNYDRNESLSKEPFYDNNTSSSRNIRISKLDVSSPEKVLETWDKHYKHVLPHCLVSPRCRVVRYEDLVLRPKENLQSILLVKNHVVLKQADK
ncbi:hypothetical protein ACTXT7_000024 [Hymenolepis weldensis]